MLSQISKDIFAETGNAAPLLPSENLVQPVLTKVEIQKTINPEELAKQKGISGIAVSAMEW